MKKYNTVITTSVSIYNYGTKLQAYAMCELFKQKGLSVFILEYTQQKKCNIFRKTKSMLGEFLRIFVYGLDYKFRERFKSEYKTGTNAFRKKIIKRYKAIDGNDKDIPHYRFYGSWESLKKYAEEFQILISGSDQVWHPILNKNNLPFYTLNFASLNAKTIAYAPSLGVDTLTQEQQDTFIPLLKGIDFISLREKTGVLAIQQLTEKKVTQVLDPTMLVGRKLWDNVLVEYKDIPRGTYCLCYLLGTNKEHRDICEYVAKKIGLKILNFAHFKKYNEADEKMSGEKLYGVTPFEFIGLIQNAGMVITDSFHCSAFSMLYHVPFITLLRFQASDSMSTNTRIYSMLEQFGFGNRILDSIVNIERILHDVPDFDRFEEILQNKRNESHQFIDEALG